MCIYIKSFGHFIWLIFKGEIAFDQIIDSTCTTQSRTTTHLNHINKKETVPHQKPHTRTQFTRTSTSSSSVIRTPFYITRSLSRLANYFRVTTKREQLNEDGDKNVTVSYRQARTKKNTEKKIKSNGFIHSG